MPRSAPIRYTIRFPWRRHHYADIEGTLPASGTAPVEIGMAVWTPGSYLVREYSRHVEVVRAFSPDGRELRVRKTRKNRWIVEGADASSLVIEYRLWCHDLSVRGNWVDEDFALLNGAATFLVPSACLHGDRCEVDLGIELPDAWSRVECALPHAEDAGDRRVVAFQAADYDTLVDSPIVAGNPEVRDFEVAGRRHGIVQVGGAGIWNVEQCATDVEKIVREHHRFWGAVPYERFLFFNLVTEGSGGLEHAESTVLMTSRWKFRPRKAYLDWLGLVSHEFYHTWNVKRLRPIELGPFEYEEEVYTRALWIAEGITNYYTDLLVLRAGLSSSNEYLERLSKFFERLHSTPGRLVQSLEDASFDAWIKLYRPDENSINSSISYYVKGAVVAFLLDAKIRRLTDDRRSLDDVLRLAWSRHSGAAGFTDAEFARATHEVAEADLSDWFERAIRSTEELDFTEAFDWFGLRFRPSDGKGEGNGSGTPWMGVTTRVENGRILVAQVLRGSPAHESGVDPADELIGIDGYRLPPEQWEQRFEQYRPGDSVLVLLSRRDAILTVPLRLGARPPETWRLEVRPESTRDEERRRATWWRGE